MYDMIWYSVVHIVLFCKKYRKLALCLFFFCTSSLSLSGEKMTNPIMGKWISGWFPCAEKSKWEEGTKIVTCYNKKVYMNGFFLSDVNIGRERLDTTRHALAKK